MHHTHTGHTNSRNVTFFRKKKRPRQCITHTQGIYICFEIKVRLYSIFQTNKRLTYLSSKEKSIVWTKKMEIDVLGKTWTLTCKTLIKVTCFMEPWNDPTVVTDILPQPVSRKTPIEVQFLTNVLESTFSDKPVNLKNIKNGIGYEISASGPQYQVRLVARVCLLSFSAQQMTRLYQNR